MLLRPRIPHLPGFHNLVKKQPERRGFTVCGPIQKDCMTPRRFRFLPRCDPEELFGTSPTRCFIAMKMGCTAFGSGRAPEYCRIGASFGFAIRQCGPRDPVGTGCPGAVDDPSRAIARKAGRCRPAQCRRQAAPDLKTELCRAGTVACGGGSKDQPRHGVGCQFNLWSRARAGWVRNLDRLKAARMGAFTGGGNTFPLFRPVPNSFYCWYVVAGGRE